MREIDRRAREEFEIPELILMEHAGAAVALEARRRFRKGVAWVFSGPGANGGDGFVAARHLDNWGIPVKVLMASSPSHVGGAAKINLQILKRLKVPIRVVKDLSQWGCWVQEKRPLGLVIDALLGTGVSGSVREPLSSMIQWINQRRCPVIAVDLPSGLSADTGLPCGVAVKATATVTFGLPKKGLSRGQGPRLRGRLTVADISLPRALV